MPRGVRLDLTGQRFGRLRALRFVDQNKHGNSVWECLCDPETGGCGATCEALGHLLRSGATRSCGCLRREVATARHMTHGHARRGAAAPEHLVWMNMIRRCEDTTTASFASHGARGITVCAEWRHDFAAFLAHIGPRPSPKHSVDRIDVNGNYEPGNVRWADAKTQSRNRRCVARITAFGETLTAPEWSERTGIDARTIAERYRKGMSPERALAGKDLRVKGLRGTHRPRRKRQPPDSSTSLA